MAIRRSVVNLSGMDENERDKNEGEGNKSADNKYREQATDFAKRTDTVQAGLEAEREVEQRKSDFDRAEKEGRSHSKGELPDDVAGTDFDKI
ncbi:MAG: hypothetical protein AUH82_01355 [Chloroflexi bacterium 13_1_40CM_4_65_13]|nr:MAG: hypothetical protein AUH82_01355 [Chloroflexi bacterium 13_1_40CM_4_65_13]